MARKKKENAISLDNVLNLASVGADAIVLQEPIFPNQKEASSFMNAVGNGCDECVTLIVQYVDTDNEPTPLYAKLLAKYKKLVASLETYENERFIPNKKFNYVTCRHCGSKLKRELLVSNECPLCHENMLREIVINHIIEYNNAISEIKDAINEEVIAFSGTEPKWMIRTYRRDEA